MPRVTVNKDSLAVTALPSPEPELQQPEPEQPDPVPEITLTDRQADASPVVQPVQPAHPV